MIKQFVSIHFYMPDWKKKTTTKKNKPKPIQTTQRKPIYLVAVFDLAKPMYKVM